MGDAPSGLPSGLDRPRTREKRNRLNSINCSFRIIGSLMSACGCLMAEYFDRLFPTYTVECVIALRGTNRNVGPSECVG